MMTYKIVVDSCCELPRQCVNDKRFERVPLGLEIDGEVIMDDDDFSQSTFLDKMAASVNAPRSFCPSPQSFAEAYETEAEAVFVFTLSSRLSGSYNSAMVGRHLYNEERAEKGLSKKKIFVCDSKSASGGETQLVIKTIEMIHAGLSYSDICVKLMMYRNQMRTYFVLNNLDSFVKNGRLKGMEAFAVNKLDVKPVMTSLDGDIVKLEQAIGMRNAIKKMVECIQKEIDGNTNRTIIISHCNARERAIEIKHMLKKHFNSAHIVIMDTLGVSSMYANDGGVIVTV